MREQWENIPGYENAYQISDKGRVRSLDRYVRTVSKTGTETTRKVKGTILNPQNHSAGYLSVQFFGKSKLIHRLVALTFFGKCPDRCEVAHNNGNKFNNSLENIRYATPKENAKDRILHGRSGKGENNPQAKLKDADVREIRALRGWFYQKVLGEIFGVRQSQISRIQLNTRRVF